MKEKTESQSQNAISVKNVSKQFIIPHDKTNTLKGAFVNIFHRKTFESFYALQDVSFEVKKGEFFGILGRNGSGKSTLLKILAGVYTADSGLIKINGLVSPFLELGIGFNPELSGRDNVYLNATILGLTEKEIDEKFDSIVAFSELERFIDQKVKNYSSGMQVRLAFSVSIHANREILLMDEVLAVGDSNFQSKCLAEFGRYKEMGKTVILVTHDIATVQRYCDRAMLLRNGKIEKIGSAEEVGTEYMYLNMSDEERRIYEEEENIKGKELGEENERIEEESKNKVAEITKVEFLDNNGNVKNVFETGDKLCIKVSYEFFENYQEPIFGISIRDVKGLPIFASNTKLMKIRTNNVNKGDIINAIFCIDNYFTAGTYNVSPAVVSSNDAIIDWRDNFASFKIMSSWSSGSIVEFNHTIKIEKK